jgi:hypothetical protein
MSSGGGAKDGDVLILTRGDLIAAFDLWYASYSLEPETVAQAVERMQVDSAAEASADTLISFLVELANQPDVELP